MLRSFSTSAHTNVTKQYIHTLATNGPYIPYMIRTRFSPDKHEEMTNEYRERLFDMINDHIDRNIKDLEDCQKSNDMNGRRIFTPKFSQCVHDLHIQLVMANRSNIDSIHEVDRTELLYCYALRGGYPLSKISKNVINKKLEREARFSDLMREKSDEEIMTQA